MWKLLIIYFTQNAERTFFLAVSISKYHKFILEATFNSHCKPIPFTGMAKNIYKKNFSAYICFEIIDSQDKRDKINLLPVILDRIINKFSFSCVLFPPTTLSKNAYILVLWE